MERQDQLGRKVVYRRRKSDRHYMEILELGLRGRRRKFGTSQGRRRRVGSEEENENNTEGAVFSLE